MEASSSHQARPANPPRTRQRAYKEPPQLDVPDIDQDAAERKRVLNVLAQRRYRAKKRQNRRSATAETQNKPNVRDTESRGTGSVASQSGETESARNSETESLGQIDNNYGVSLDLTGWDPLNNDIVPPLLAEPVPELLPPYFSIEEITMTQQDVTFATAAGPGPVSFFDQTSPATGATATATTATTTSPPSSVPSPSPINSGFPDSYLLPVHELTVLRALLRIADRLGCKEQMWSLDAVSPFSKGLGSTLAVDQLPPAWQPTASQLLIPHHPILDFLPWPGTRDRIINVFALPDEARPPNAAGPLALVNFAYDLEDNAEGVRIYGGDPYDGSCWEVGQLLFERWWFLFDRDIVENSNRWRRLRGAPPLLLNGGACNSPMTRQ